MEKNEIFKSKNNYLFHIFSTFLEKFKNNIKINNLTIYHL